MPGISIQSGVIQLDSASEAVYDPATQGPLKVLILADYSGRASRNISQTEDLGSRKQIRVDKDNFHEVFERLRVSLSLPICDTAVEFNEFEDLNPDHIYEKVGVFDNFRKLIRQLKSPQNRQFAIDELSSQGLIAQAKEEAKRLGVEPANLLDAVLGNQTTSSQDSGFSVEALIRQTIAPYVEAKTDPKLDEYISAVENAASDMMRSILHTSAFQQMEASWRSLDLLNRRLDTDRSCHLHIMDVAVRELHGEVSQYQYDPSASGFCRGVVTANSVVGGRSYDLIVLDHVIEDCPEDLALVKFLAAIAAMANAKLLLGSGVSSVVGDNPQALVEGDTITEPCTSDAWQELRNSDRASSVFIAAPRYLVRQPYGTKTRPIDAIRFEELPATGIQHNYYLWGSSAYLLLFAFVQEYRLQASQGQVNLCNAKVEGLPIHVTEDADGDDLVVPSTEYYLPSGAVALLERAGLTVVQSIKNSDAVLIGRWLDFQK